ncbi:hypothetical protein RJ639_002471 [Escallonia herrerae]|uniref:Uncharacterized protein n=1 Tax=Escallonia herrerae TaxID=1293975 RepID=A0AA89BJA0_9ASTE|nr:hypothetical protein RJ639_002471 [Escallonia herrerae]
MDREKRREQLASVDMDTNGNEEDGDQSKEDDGVHQDGCATGLHVAKLHHPVPAGQLEEQPRRQHHEQHHRHQHRTPVRHQNTRPLHLLALSYIMPQRERNREIVKLSQYSWYQ